MSEHQQREWKAAWRDEYLKWICGFANADGGVLEIGRNDEGEPVGLADAGRLLEENPNKVRDVLGIMVDVNLQLEDGQYLKQATALLFGSKPERFVPGAFIKIGFFVTDDDLRYQDEVHGDLFTQVKKTLDLLYSKYLKAYIRYEGVQRVERFLFPFQALREALLNAVLHKDYASGIPIQISVYEHQIVIWNPGQLPDNWTQKQLLSKHPSHPFNPLLASAFFRAGCIESCGRSPSPLGAALSRSKHDGA